jgi:ADP-heptose:LPS heptosyltransferase
MACSPQARASVQQWLAGQGVGADVTIVALHPSASGPEKRWPAEAFAKLADRLVREARARVVLVAGAEGVADCEAVARAMRAAPLRADGVFDLQELAALLARARLLISNDSGPVHVAVSQGAPVIAQFGRTQPGVNPERWRPLGPRDVVLCREPLSALSPDEVFRSAAPFLQSPT